jgi:hypothetical protein
LTGRLGAVGAVGWPSDGHGVAQAASGEGATGGGASAAAQRRRKRYMALGCTDLLRLFTRMCSGARRALRWPPGAVRGALDGGRRDTRRRNSGEAEPAARSTTARADGAKTFLTLRRSLRRNRWRRSGSGTARTEAAGTRQRPARVSRRGLPKAAATMRV